MKKPDSQFIEAQRQRLRALRTSLTAVEESNVREGEGMKGAGRESREREEDAQRLEMLELEGNLTSRDLTRLERIDRALQKIEEGTYGCSDETGAAIPRARLEAVPEAIYTLDEEKRREHRR